MKLLQTQTQTSQLHFLCAFQNKHRNKPWTKRNVINSPAVFSGGSLYVFLPDLGLKNTNQQLWLWYLPTALCPAVNSDTRNHNQTPLSLELHPWDSFSAPKRCPMSSFSVVVSSGITTVFIDGGNLLQSPNIQHSLHKLNVGCFLTGRQLATKHNENLCPLV